MDQNVVVLQHKRRTTITWSMALAAKVLKAARVCKEMEALLLAAVNKEAPEKPLLQYPHDAASG